MMLYSILSQITLWEASLSACGIKRRTCVRLRCISKIEARNAKGMPFDC